MYRKSNSRGIFREIGVCLIQQMRDGGIKENGKKHWENIKGNRRQIKYN